MKRRPVIRVLVIYRERPPDRATYETPEEWRRKWGNRAQIRRQINGGW